MTTKGNACGNCGKTLVTDECAFCGWTRTSAPAASDTPRMPTLADALNVIAEQVEQFRGKRPDGMPADSQAAARWLHEKVLEKHQPEEAPQLKSRSKGKAENATTEWFWVWSYLARLKIQTRQFLHLPRDEQRYIIAAKEDGIPWRGDDSGFFRKVVAEHQRMQEIGVEAYRREALTKMRVLVRAMKTEEAA